MSDHPVPVSLDLNEGRFLEIGCVECKTDVNTRLAKSQRFPVYFVSLDCPSCGEELVEFDTFMGVTRIWRTN
jgi:ribosomal protein S27E